MKKSFYVAFLIIIFKIKSADTPLYIDIWVVWNIGQGQWVTHIQSDECTHYDIGGEFGSFKNLRKSLLYSCGKKLNKLNLSHWDYDHFMNLPLFIKSIPKVCWNVRPVFANTKKSAQKILALNIPDCQHPDPDLKKWSPLTSKNTNESSVVFLKSNVLMPGDSPIQKEKLWASEFNAIQSTQVLILGHHGSRTSTGGFLLSKLDKLYYSIASARYLKYRHPHSDTLTRLSEHKIPILKTEEWGHIWFETLTK